MMGLGLLWLSLLLIFGYRQIDLPAAVFHSAYISQIHDVRESNVLPIVVGEANEPCDTEQSIPGTIVLSPQDSWEERLTDGAGPGNIFLLRGGLYQATDKLWLKAGTPATPIVIKPYNCEAVTLQSSIRPNSYTVIAGLRIEAIGIEDTKWVIRFDGKDQGVITDITLRNNTILGGTIDAIRLTDAVHNVLIQGNHIDGGQAGHDIFVTAETAGALPDAITITQNRLTKHHFDSASEDMIQVRDVGMVTITANICTDGFDMEQCIDIKSATVPLLIAHNFFDGDNLHLAGTGADQAGGCMVIHESDGHAEQHIIEHNDFRHCKGTSIRFAPGTRDDQSSGLLQYNIFVQESNQDGVIPIEAATDLVFRNNTIIRGALKLGNSDQTRLPHTVVFQNNIFYQTAIEDNTVTPASTYQCAYNLLYQLAGDGFSMGSCTHTVDDDPRFVDFTNRNFYLQPGSPAIGTGENGSDIGALPNTLPTGKLSDYLFLPLILH